MILSDIIKTYLAQGTLILAIYGVLSILLDRTTLFSRPYEYVTGIFFGLTASIAMLMPIAFHPGYIFDLRGVILVFAPVFGGLTSAVIATIIAVITRLIIGGEGSITGVVAILVAVGAGTIYRFILKGKLDSLRNYHYLPLGIAVQMLTFGGFLYFLPPHLFKLILFQLGLIILLANVSLTWVLGFMLQNRIKQYQTTRSLSSSSQRLKTLLHTLPDLVWLKDANGCYAACNKRFEDFVGHPEEYILGKTDYDLFGKEIAESFQKHDQLAITSRGPRTNEEEIQFAIDGHREMVETIKTPIFNPDDSLIGVLGIARNITDHARIEKQLRTSEQRFRESFEKSGIFRTIINLNGRMDSVNEAFAHWLGYSVEQLIDTVHAEYLHNGDREYFETFIRRLLNENKESGQLEGRYISKDGQLKWAIINFVLLRDDRGTPMRFLLDVQDVTNLKSMKSNLETLEKRFRLAIENIPDVIVIYDADRRIRYINKATENLTGKKPADLIGYRDEEIWPPALYESYLPTLKQVMNTKTRRSVEVELKFNEQDAKNLLINIVPILNKSGDIQEVVGITQDLTEQYTTRRKIETYARETELAFQSIVNVIIKIGEIRDPYTAGHERRVGEIAAAIAVQMGLDQKRVESIRIGGYLHDIGKLSVPQEILAKPGRLTDGEFTLIREHPRSGYNILSQVDLPWPVATMALQHHERMDGSGYPQGLKSEEILLESRIMAVADVVEAMSSHRPYRAGLGIDAALSEIKRGAGSIYDPVVARTCLDLFGSGRFKIPE